MTTLTQRRTAVKFSRQDAAKALRQLRQTLPDFSPEKNAVNKAAMNLEACIWQFDGITLVIESASVGRRTYHATADTCNCPAGNAARGCWHRAAIAVLLRAQAFAAPQPRTPMSDDDYAAVCAAADELF